MKVPPKWNPQLVHLGCLYLLAYAKRQLGHLPLPRSQEAYKAKEKYRIINNLAILIRGLNNIKTIPLTLTLWVGLQADKNK